MLVHQILKSKASNAVTTVTAQSKVSDAAALLAEKKIGTVVVSSDGKSAEGILSERDIVQQLALLGSPCLDQTVAELMTANPVTCGPTDTADAILAQMTEGRFRHIPVVSDGAMIGLISIGDVVKARLSELQTERDALEGMITGH